MKRIVPFGSYLGRDNMRSLRAEKISNALQQRRNIKMHQVRPDGKCADKHCKGTVKNFMHGCLCSKKCGRLHFYSESVFD